MSSNSMVNLCALNDTLCTITQHELEIIIVPSLLLLGTLVTLIAVFILRYCQEQKGSRHYKSSSHRRSQRHSHRRDLNGIDAPPGINPLEHEVLPMSVQHVQQNVKPQAAAPLTSTERQHGAFSQITELPQSFPSSRAEVVTLYRARMDNRDVVLRVLKEKQANNSEKQYFLGFASFVSGLGPHPYLPALLGVVSVQSPVMMVVEELQHRDLLRFLWKCRQDNVDLDTSCNITEKNIFSMAGQVASALEYLHSQSCIHGSVAARSVLVGRDLTAKLWGLSSAYRMKTLADLPGDMKAMEMRKWQAPEVLVRRHMTQMSDVWSFGILLYEMVTLGDPPFAQVMASEILQHLQRGKHLKRPANCSNSLYSIIKSCWNWKPEHRLTMHELTTKLQAGEKSANGSTALRASEPIDIERYLREVGYGELNNYSIL